MESTNESDQVRVGTNLDEGGITGGRSRERRGSRGAGRVHGTEMGEERRRGWGDGRLEKFGGSASHLPKAAKADRLTDAMLQAGARVGSRGASAGGLRGKWVRGGGRCGGGGR